MNILGSKPALGSVRRRSVTLRPAEPVKYGTLPGCGGHPFVVEARMEGLRLSA